MPARWRIAVCSGPDGHPDAIPVFRVGSALIGDRGERGADTKRVGPGFGRFVVVAVGVRVAAADDDGASPQQGVDLGLGKGLQVIDRVFAWGAGTNP